MIGLLFPLMLLFCLLGTSDWLRLKSIPRAEVSAFDRHLSKNSKNKTCTLFYFNKRIIEYKRGLIIALINKLSFH